MTASGCFSKLKAAYPNAHICGCTTSGEILETQVLDNSISVTAVAFEHTEIQISRVEIPEMAHSFDAGRRLVEQLPRADLKHIFVLGEGLLIRKSQLVAGMNSAIPDSVTISGGFASDNNQWQHTHVWCDDAPAESIAIGIGFYGKRLRVGVAAAGGWDAFGPDRRITRHDGRIIYELDGREALDLYKRYLGEHAAGLPATGALFPLGVHCGSSQSGGMIRAVENVDHAAGSLIMGGDIPDGWLVRMMTGNMEHLIDGARQAADLSKRGLKSSAAQLAIIVSCGGRRPVLKHRIDEEVEAAADVLGSDAKITGFYSFGEIAPIGDGCDADLHNETLAIVCFSEE